MHLQYQETFGLSTPSSLATVREPAPCGAHRQALLELVIVLEGLGAALLVVQHVPERADHAQVVQAHQRVAQAGRLPRRQAQRCARLPVGRRGAAGAAPALRPAVRRHALQGHTHQYGSESGALQGTALVDLSAWSAKTPPNLM